jgi:hypothetical protein
MLKLSWFDPEELRRQYKVVHTESYEDIPGHILIADARTGMCLLKTQLIDTPMSDVRFAFGQEYDLGSGGLAIVKK